MSELYYKNIIRAYLENTHTDVTITKHKKSRKPYFKRFSGFFVMHFLFGCYREILNFTKSLKGTPLRHFYIKSFYIVTTVCTVDFETPNCFAAVRTVAFSSII